MNDDAIDTSSERVQNGDENRQVPSGWYVKRCEDGDIIVSKDGLGGYAARKDDESIASSILAHFADDILIAIRGQQADAFKDAYMEWSAKTDWVQEQIATFPPDALGKHRADVMREEIERLRAAHAALLRERDEWKARAEKGAEPTDMARKLRDLADRQLVANAAMCRAAADEIDRFYNGMMAWKQTAETKDRKLSEGITARINERVEARLKEQAAPELSEDQIMEIAWQFQAGGDEGKFTFLADDLPEMFRALLAAGKAGE